MSLKRVSNLYVSYLLAVFAAILTVGITLPANAKAQPTAIPDVIVLIISGAFPTDAVSITYNSVVDKSTVDNDMSSILKATGWQANGWKITSSSQPKSTSVEFMSNSIVNWKDGTLLVEPLAIAFRRYNNIKISYLLQGNNFPFKSLRDYSNRYVDITWTGSATSADYYVQVKDHNFDKLDLPLVVEVDENGKPKQSSGGSKTWLAFIIAIAAGVVVYSIMNRTTRK